jgi:methionyl-tRNA formyltransferase
VTNPEELSELSKQVPLRYIFFLHWNWLVLEEIWQRVECVCFHMTDVPYGRGGSPLQNLIKAGHEHTKLSALRMVHEMDAGPVYVKEPLSLDGRAKDIYERAGQLSYEIIRWMIEAEPTPEAQEGHIVTFKRRVPRQSELPKGVSLEALYDHIRMLDAPTYPHAFIERDGYRYEFTEATLRDDELQATVVIRPTSTAETIDS